MMINIINDFILRYGFGKLLIYMLFSLYIIVILLFHSSKRMIWITTIIFVIIEIILIMMYTAHQ